VAIVKIRVYLDFDLDESYTPTKMMFFAGMGGNDLVHFATWEDDTPAGWVNISLSGVGGRNKRRKSHAVRDKRRRTQNGKSSKGVAGIDDGDMYDDSADEEEYEDDSDDPYAGNVLKAMVIQVRICENHQNGKDTHVRGFQVFAHDDDRRRIAAATAGAANAGQPGHNRRKSVQNDPQDVFGGAVDEGTADKSRGLDEPDWMGEPVIR
jgi:anaphase-promoting complex subunit 10